MYISITMCVHSLLTSQAMRWLLNNTRWLQYNESERKNNGAVMSYLWIY